MEQTILGCTGLKVSRSGFGSIPIQRISFEDAKLLLRKAYDNGINFFDTARAYTNSEEKIGYALSDVRANIVLATKSGATTKKELFAHLETSLKNLKTDYIDIYQLHNPSVLSDPNDPDSAYAGVLEAKQKGMIRFIGITQHSKDNALMAIKSGLYDTLQYPFSMLSSEEDLALAQECKRANMGVIAMKALAGGLITNAAAAFAFLRQYEQIVPIWGIEKMQQLDEFLTYESNPPMIDEAMQAVIEKDRKELTGSFCRACGYCLPCPVGIQIPTAARICLLLRRMPYEQFMTAESKEQMDLVKGCLHCGACSAKCPYGLDIPNLLKEMYAQYKVLYEKYSQR